ncbi:hypothetical protein CR51_36075 [Caballeronia megalochromosomata]|nr:hypothetical protein CR51_36075 [Caballeronia megalochromosomata]
MNRSAYLHEPYVAGFVTFLSELITGAVPLAVSVGFSKSQLYAGFTDRFPGDTKNRDGGGPVHIVFARTLKDLFAMYWWDGKDFDQTYTALEVARTAIRTAIEGEQGGHRLDLALQASHEVMKWGFGEDRRAYRANMNWAKRQKEGLVQALRVGREALIGDNPSIEVFGNDVHQDRVAHGEMGAPRMNAGWTKYFALALPGHIIYDGRVGAALGFLVRRYLERLPEHERPAGVPEALAFLWGDGVGGGKLRDPSDGPYQFSKLYGGRYGSKSWARVNVWANWVLAEARERATAAWCAGPHGLRALEAALFMLGYDLCRAGKTADGNEMRVGRTEFDAHGAILESKRQLPSITDVKFREGLRQARLAAGLSYGELARQAGIHAVMPSRYENATHSNATLPSEQTWKKLNAVLFPR